MCSGDVCLFRYPSSPPYIQVIKYGDQCALSWMFGCSRSGRNIDRSFGAEITNLAGSKCGAHVDRVTVPEITGCSSRIPTLFQPS